MALFDIDLYTTSSGDIPVNDFLSDLKRTGQQKDLRKTLQYIEHLRYNGLNINQTVARDAMKPLHGYDGLYELRPGNNRIFFFCFVNNKIVLLHGFRKRSNKTPVNELEQAMREMQDHIRRNLP